MRFHIQQIYSALLMVTLLSAPVVSFAGPGGTGGGNSLAGEMIESYIVDPQDTAAGKILETRLQIVSQKSPDLYALMQIGLADRTWYFLPAKLKQLSQQVTGIPFGSTQTAIQQLERREVWVDSTSYTALKDNTERAKLLAHEALLGGIVSYYSRFIGNRRMEIDEIKAMVRGTTALVFSSRFLSMSSAEVSEKLHSLGFLTDEQNRILCYSGYIYGSGYTGTPMSCVEEIQASKKQR